MRTLIRFLRPYTGLIILIFLLLFAQAMSDLALPGYMSRIVNIGIAQHGVSSALPAAIRAGQMDKLSLLMDPAEAATLRGQYQLLSRSGLSASEFEKQVKIYPLLQQEDILVLRDPKTELDAPLRTSLSKALLIMRAVSGDMPLLQLEGLPSGMDAFQLLAGLTDEQRSQLLDQIGERYFAGINESLAEQSAITVVRAEYEAIGVDLLRIQNRFLLSTGGLMLLIALAGAICSISVGLLGSLVAARTARDLRRAVFVKVEGFSSNEFDQFSTASLITRTTNDVQRIQMSLVMMMRTLFYAPILATGGIIRVIGSNQSMAWIIAVAVAVLMLLIIALFFIAVPKFKLIQKLIDRLNLVTRELLSGLMVVRAFNNQVHQEEKFDTVNQDLTKTGLFIGRLMTLLMPLIMLIMNGVSLLIIWVGAAQIDRSAMQVGDMMAFIQYAIQIIMSFIMVSMLFIFLPHALVSMQRIAEVLAIKTEITDPSQPRPFPRDGQGRVEFRHVGFSYKGAEDSVLKDISFTAEPGQTTAIIGSTGCGKSTLVSLLPRFYDVTEGQVLIDGVDVREASLAALRQRIGFVAQKGVLFSGSIQFNIAYGRDGASEEEIRSAAATAQALDFIEASDQEFDTPIAQGGANVSGGQKQRLSIARALVRKPSVYIFDDTFSALDYRTDAALRQALRAETSAATVLIVAQRIGTIRHAEKIIVLDKGLIVGTGTHEQLLASCAVYKEIALSQLSEEEAAG